MMTRATDLYPQEILDDFVRLGRATPPWVTIKEVHDSDHFAVDYYTPPGCERVIHIMRGIIDRVQRAEEAKAIPLSFTGRAGDWLANYAGSKWLANGPKVCRPSAERAEAMANIEIRLGVKDVAMPFTEMVVELPPIPAVGPYRWVLLAEGPPMKDGRKFPMLVGSIMTEDHIDDIVSVLRDRPAPWTIEETLDKYREDCKGLEDFCRAALRIGLNCCMLLSGSLSMALPAEYLNDKRLAAEKTERGERARRRIALAVQVAEFDQTIAFKKTEGSHPAGEPTGRQMSPHWRRGHWRMQPCGIARQERKRILIPPVMVRSDLFAGEASDTAATYKA